MRAVVTGASGAVGTALVDYLKHKKITVIRWNRGEVPIDAYYPMEDFLRAVRPDILFHLAIASKNTGRENENWLVNYEWPSELAWITRILNIAFVFTSSVAVFSDHAQGPFTLDAKPDASEGYGNEKRMAEQRVFFQNPQARIARLGWQIGDAPGSNNMVDYLHKKMAENGEIRASTKWLPSCSMLADTARALFQIAQKQPGLYQVNANDRWNFYEIAVALNEIHGNPWKVTPVENFVYDQRMIDKHVKIPPLEKRLKTLASPANL